MKKRRNRKWNEIDKTAFSDGLRTRAQTFIDRRKQVNKKWCRSKHRDDY